MTGPRNLLLVAAVVLTAAAMAVLALAGDRLGFMAVATVAIMWFSAMRAGRPKAARAKTSDRSYEGLLAELNHSRREIVGAFEIERRRIERDLHDGAQQYLVAAAIKVGEASLHLNPDSESGTLLTAAQDDADQALKALRQTVHGIQPQTLTDLGLELAVKDLAARFPEVRVRCPHPLPPLPQGVVASGYFFVSEALANAVKHAPNAKISVLLAADESLRISVTDNGPGGAVLRSGHGLSGMRERLAAFGGELSISSPTGGPTQLLATMPLLLRTGHSGYLDRIKETRA